MAPRADEDFDRELEAELERMADMEEPKSRRHNRHSNNSFDRYGRSGGMTIEGVLTTVATVGLAVMACMVIYKSYIKPRM